MAVKKKKATLPNPREQFITGIYIATGSRNEAEINAILGADRIAQFKWDGIIPPEWRIILAKYPGSQERLDRYKRESHNFNPALHPRKKPPKREEEEQVVIASEVVAVTALVVPKAVAPEELATAVFFRKTDPITMALAKKEEKHKGKNGQAVQVLEKCSQPESTPVLIIDIPDVSKIIEEASQPSDDELTPLTIYLGQDGTLYLKKDQQRLKLVNLKALLSLMGIDPATLKQWL